MHRVHRRSTALQRKLAALGSVGAIIIGSGAFITTAHAAMSVSCSNTRPNVEKCRVSEPDVKHSSSDYRAVRFQPGDRVTVLAGGCVQTGGHGRTWKRYVDPLGDNSDRLYHGLIWIPGATPNLVRIASVLGRPLSIPKNVPPAELFLRLGYEDDGYDDNGYWGHDDGNYDQCKNSVNAWVELTIEHNATPISGPHKPFDLVWDTIDPNFAPLNPKWGYQVDHPGQFPTTSMCGNFEATSSGVTLGSPPCASEQPNVDTPSGFNSMICHFEDNGGKLHGHVNWGVGTYIGSLKFQDHSSDDDWDLDLDGVPNHDGLLAVNGGVHKLEFDTDETIDNFHSQWWEMAHSAVDNGTGASVFDGKEAIITGQIGLDCEHDCHAELHPVYAMAVHADASNPADDVWAIWARNWGDEGFCSQNQHYVDFPDRKYVFNIPWRAGATGVTVGSHDFKANNPQVTGPDVVIIPHQSVRIAFTLPEPEAQGFVNGSLHLKWTGGAPMKMVARPEIVNRPAGPKLGLADEHLAALERDIPAEKKSAYVEQVKKAKRAIHPAQPSLVPRLLGASAVPMPEQREHLRDHARPATRVAPDPKKAARDNARHEALCAAYNGKVPGQPTLCTTAPK